MIQTIAPNRLSGTVSRIADVSERDRCQMFQLMTRYYDNVRRDTFDSDFDSKTWVIVAKCQASGEVMGFSTQWFGEYLVDGSSVGVLYSGDTIVDQRYWAKNPLATLWGRLALELIERHPEREMLWFLISKGYKTYRFLPVFFKTFYPRPNQTFPLRYQRLIDRIAGAKFGSQYLPSSGIVKATRDGCRLRGQVAAVTEQRLRDPHVQFFDSINPGHADGDELCCIAPLTRDNFNDAAYRVIAMPVDSRRALHIC